MSLSKLAAAVALAFAGVVYLGYDRHWLGLGLDPDPVNRSATYPDGQVNDARSAVDNLWRGLRHPLKAHP